LVDLLKKSLPLEGKKMYEEILDRMQELLKDEIKNFAFFFFHFSFIICSCLFNGV